MASHEIIRFDCLGVGFELETARPDLLPALSERLPPPGPRVVSPRCDRRYALDAGGQSQKPMILRRGSRKPIPLSDVGHAADLIAADIQRFLAFRAEGLLFLHAGAVALRGRALVLPGRSGSGKSRLVAALLAAGAEYLSDEFAVLDEQGRAHPYARPLGLRRDGGRIDRVRPERIGARVARGPLPVTAIAFLHYRPGAPSEPTRISPGGVVLALLRHALAARRRFELAQTILPPLASRAVAWKGARGEAEEAARGLLREVEAAGGCQ